MAAAVGGASALLRAKEAPDLVGADAAAILAAMAVDPILINRPVVIAPKGVILARPSETVLALL